MYNCSSCYNASGRSTFIEDPYKGVIAESILNNLNKYQEPTESNSYTFQPDEEKYKTAKENVRRFLYDYSTETELKDIENDLKYIVLFDAYRTTQSPNYTQSLGEIFNKIKLEYDQDLGTNIYGVTQMIIKDEAITPQAEKRYQKQTHILSHVDEAILKYIDRLAELKNGQYIPPINQCSNVLQNTEIPNENIDIYRVALDKKLNHLPKEMQVYVVLHELRHVAHKDKITSMSEECLEYDADYAAYRLLNEISTDRETIN